MKSKKIDKLKSQNEAFEKMSKSEKRIAIAKDVIASIKSGKYNAQKEVYCSIDVNPEYNFEKKGKSELQTLMHSGAISSCTVCAIGGIFASKVFLGNKFKVSVNEKFWSDELEIENTYIEDTEMMGSFRGIYTIVELREIEYAFEGWDIRDSFKNRSEEFHYNMINFYDKYPDVELRLIAIMKNIIKNEGNFKP